MHDTIGNAAGEIWNVLSSRKTPVVVTDLPKLTKLKTQVCYQALGWLAREGKIEYTEKSGKTSVSLAPAECCF